MGMFHQARMPLRRAKHCSTSAAASDLRYLSNQDIDYTPRADQWANGVDPAAELTRVMKVRRSALNRFGESAIRQGWPMAMMEEALVPLFLHHRYQVESTASVLGGQHYVYAMRGSNEPAPQAVSAAEQNAALSALTATLRASELVVPAAVLDKLPPRPSGYPRHRELFPRHTGLPFDPVTPGLVAADLTIQFVLAPERAARLVAQHARDIHIAVAEQRDRSARLPRRSKTNRRIRTKLLVNQAVERALVERLMTLAKDAPMAQVRAVATASLLGVRARGQAMLGTR